MKKIQAIAALLLLAFLSCCDCTTAQTEDAAVPLPENAADLISADGSTEPTAEEILLEKAQQFHDLMRDYLNTDDDLLIFDLGHDGCDQNYLNVISDMLTDYQSVKDIFTEALSDDYADYMLRDRTNFPVFMEKNNVLYFAPSESTYIGYIDSWCVGYEETESKIVGRFASLGGVPGHPEGNPDEEYLNDLGNYLFYNITLEKFPEGYRITDCMTDQNPPYLAYGRHTFYHSGVADLSKITNPELLPIDISEKENTLNEISTDTGFELNEIFTEQAEVLTDYDVNDFPVRSEQAISDLIDTLIASNKYRDDMKWILTEMVTLDQEAYYQITLSTENEYLYSAIATFWVNANSGTIYLKFDPTLDKKGYFSEYSGNIPENDGRTRLIAFP